MVNVAVVGCGYWGPNLARNFSKVPGCTLRTVCDTDPNRLAPLQRAYPKVKATTSFQEALLDDEVDAIALATPLRTHFKLGKEALLYGKHLLVEKPLAMTSEECQVLIDLAQKQGLALMVGHTFLYSPSLLKVKELSTPDYLGDIYYIHTQRVNLGKVQSDVSALWSLAPHDVSIVLHLLGKLPTELWAHGSRFIGDRVEDLGFIDMKFDSGQMAHIHVSWLDPMKQRKVTVVGSRRMIVYDDVAEEAKVKVYDKRVIRELGEILGEARYTLHSGEVETPSIDPTEPLLKECEHFIECIREGRRPLSDGRNGLQVVQVLEAAQSSLDNNGAEVRLDSLKVRYAATSRAQ